MQPEYLTKAYIIQVFDLDGKRSGFALAFPLPSELILVFSNDKPRGAKDRVRRFLRVLKRDGGMVRTQEPELFPLKNLPHIYLKDEELKEIFKDEYETFNNRIGSGSNVREWW